MRTHILALPCLILAVGGVAAAQTANKVGVIQAQSAIVSTREGQKATTDLEARLEPRKKELEKKQTEIRELQDKLQRGGSAMAEAAKNDLVRTIDQKTKSYNRDMEDAEAEYQEQTRKLMDEMSGKMMQVIDKYAAANGFSIILDVSNPNTPVLYASNAVDVTKDIIELYDKSAPGSPATPGAKPAAAPKPPPAIPPAAKKQP